MLADGIITGLFVEDQGLSGGEAGIVSRKPHSA